jgi:hypothetical protein
VRASVRLYLAGDGELALLEKEIEFPSLPLVGEFVKLKNRGLGSYFAIRVAEITHVEEGTPDVMLETLELPPSELEQYIASYGKEGWTLRSHKRQPREHPH